MVKRYVVATQSVFLLLVVFAFSSGASAGIFCWKPKSPEIYRVSELKMPVSIKKADDPDSKGGKVLAEFVELPEDTSQAVASVVRMFVFSSASKIKQDRHSGKIEELVLGIPLKSGYTLELTYDRKEGAKDMNSIESGEDVVTAYRGLYFDNKAEIVGPPPDFVRTKAIRLDIRRRDGTVQVQKKMIEPALADIPGLRDYNFEFKIPQVISGETLTILERISLKLQYYPDKSDLLQFLQNPNAKSLDELEKKLFLEQQKSMQKDYNLRGFPKMVAKIWQKPIIAAIGIGAAVGTVSVAPELSYDTYHKVKSAVTFSDKVMASTVEGFSKLESLPLEARNDAMKLQRMVEESVRSGQLSEDLDQFPVDYQSDKKVHLGKKAYVWFETRTSPENGQIVEVLYVLRVGSSNDSLAMAMQIDPKQIPNFYSYIKNRGNFVKLGED